METAAPRSRSRRPNKNPMRAGLVVGIVLGKSGCSSVHALVSGASVAAAPSFVRGYSAPPPPRQSSALSLGRGRVRRRQGDCRLSATGGSGGAGDMDSSELYADMRRRLEVGRRGGAEGEPEPDSDCPWHKFRIARVAFKYRCHLFLIFSLKEVLQKAGEHSQRPTVFSVLPSPWAKPRWRQLVFLRDWYTCAQVCV